MKAQELAGLLDKAVEAGLNNAIRIASNAIGALREEEVKNDKLTGRVDELEARLVAYEDQGVCDGE